MGKLYIHLIVIHDQISVFFTNRPIGVPYFGSLFAVSSGFTKFLDDRYSDGELSCFYFGSIGVKPVILINELSAANFILKHKLCTGRNPYVEPVRMGFPFQSRFVFIDNTENCIYRRK